jgi:uncharacterized membrane protein YgcG
VPPVEAVIHFSTRFIFLFGFSVWCSVPLLVYILTIFRRSNEKVLGGGGGSGGRPGGGGAGGGGGDDKGPSL